MTDKRLLYFADPMCSWCWGFSAVIREIADQFAEQAPVRIHVGGLRANHTNVMNETQRLTILSHWHQVARASGQPFDFGFNMPDGFIYDTEPACRAVKTMQQLSPAQALDYFHAIQHAFYVHNIDVTQANALADLAGEFDLDPREFERAFNSADLIQQTQLDFEFTQQINVSGFPSLIGHYLNRYAVITHGYQPYSPIAETVTRWLHGSALAAQ